MHTVGCPVCSSENLRFLGFGLVAPWITELSHISNSDILTKLVECLDCNLQFFDRRYSDLEMERLYSGYRSEVYFALRHAWEPWYSRKTMEAWNPTVNPRGVEARKNFMEDAFDEVGVKIHSIVGCLDFGGDLGQFFPDGIQGNKYLYDPSAVSIDTDEIVKISDLNEIVGKIGLVMNCHTLEHLVNPHEVVRKLAHILPDDGILYVEVPFDRFRVSSFHRSSLYREYLLFISKYQRIFIMIDFLTGIYRLFFHKIPLLGIVKQSEHINYFSPETLNKLLSRSAFRHLALIKPDKTFGQGIIKLGRLSIVGFK